MIEPTSSATLAEEAVMVLKGILGELSRLPIVERVKEVGGRHLANKLTEHFPGLTPEALSRGWVPISLDIIAHIGLEHLREKDERIEDVRLSGTDDGALRIEVDTRTYRVISNKVAVNLYVEDFEVRSPDSVITFRCEGNPTVEGRNLIGKLLVSLVEKVIVDVLSARSQGAKGDTDAAVNFRWPFIDVHLNRIPLVQEILDYRIHVFRITDFMVMGPVRVKPKHVELRLQPTDSLHDIWDLMVY